MSRLFARALASARLMSLRLNPLAAGTTLLAARFRTARASSASVTAARSGTQPLAAAKRANLDCDFFSDPLDILLGRKPCSAHCLMMDPHWYGGYGLGEAMLQFEITATLTYGGSDNSSSSGSNSSAAGSIPGSQEVLVLSPTFPWALSSSRTLSAKLLGDLAGYSQLPVLSERVLMIPHPKSGQTVQDMLGIRTEWMLIDRSKISFDGSECDKVGTSFTAFRYQTGSCIRAPQVCLTNQLQDILEADRGRIAAGRVPLYLVSQYTYGLDSQLKAFRGGVLSFALPVVGLRSSLVLLEASADKIKFVTNTSPGKIAAARMCQFSETKCGGFEASAARGYLHALIVNTGTLDSSYTLSVTNCSVSIRPVEAQRFALAAGKNGTISPFQIYVEDDKATQRYCWLVLLDSLGKVTDAQQVSFYTNATSYGDWPSGGLLGNGTGPGTLRNKTCTACKSSLNVLCAARNSCWGRVKGFVGGLLGAVLGVALLAVAAKMGWLSTLLQLCGGLCSCGGSSSTSNRREKSSSSRREPEQQQSRRGSRAAGRYHYYEDKGAGSQSFDDEDDGSDGEGRSGRLQQDRKRDVSGASGRQYGCSRAASTPFDSYDDGAAGAGVCGGKRSSTGKGVHSKSSGRNSISGFAMANPLWQQEEPLGPSKAAAAAAAAVRGGRRLGYNAALAAGAAGIAAARVGRAKQTDESDSEGYSAEGDPYISAARRLRPTRSSGGSSSQRHRLPVSPFEGMSRQHRQSRSAQPAQLDHSLSGSSLSSDEAELHGQQPAFEDDFDNIRSNKTRNSKGYRGSGQGAGLSGPGRGRGGSTAATAGDGGYRDYDSASGQHYSSTGGKQLQKQQLENEWQQQQQWWQQRGSGMGAAGWQQEHSLQQHRRPDMQEPHRGSMSSPEQGHNRFRGSNNYSSSSSGLLPQGHSHDAAAAAAGYSALGVGRSGLQRSLSSSPLPSNSGMSRSSSIGSRMAAYTAAAGTTADTAAAAAAGNGVTGARFGSRGGSAGGSRHSQHNWQSGVAAGSRLSSHGGDASSSSSNGETPERQRQQSVLPTGYSGGGSSSSGVGLTRRHSAGSSKSNVTPGSSRASLQQQQQQLQQGDAHLRRLRQVGSGLSSAPGGYTQPPAAATMHPPRASVAAAAAAAATRHGRHLPVAEGFLHPL